MLLASNGVKTWGIAAVAAAIIAAVLFTYTYTNAPTVTIGGHTIFVEIQDTDSERNKGLSGRSSLAEGRGMLFVFEGDGIYSFWMKDMLFPIDIIWISSNGNIVDINENVAPDTYPKTFSSQSPARYVLELPANTVKRLRISVGDIVRL